MASGKFSQPRQPKHSDLEQPIPQPGTGPAMPSPIEDLPEEVIAFMRETDVQDASFAPPGRWQDQTQVVPPTQAPPEDWRNRTQVVPDNWRDATQVVTEQPRRPAAPQSYTPPVRQEPPQYRQPVSPQPSQEWTFEEPPQPRPQVRNHMAEEYFEDEDYGYPQPQPTGSSKKVIIISLCVLVLVALLGTIFVVSRVFGGKKEADDGLILNNVFAAGVNLGGMTPDQAKVALYRATDNTYAKKTMVVHLPDTDLELRAADTMVKLNVSALVDAAFGYGRNGTNSENQRAKDAAARGQQHVIPLLAYLELDESYVRDQLKDYGEYFNSTFSESSYKFQGTKPELAGDKYDENAPCETLVIYVGTPGRHVDVDKVFDQILDAYSENIFEVQANSIAPEELPQEIDLDFLFEKFCSTPIDAYMDMQTFEVITETYGYTFDLEEAKVLMDQSVYGDTLEITMEYMAPEILGEELKEVLFRDTLASYETRHTDDVNRNTNLKLACEAINGTLLNPGDTFSFNDVVGKRTEAAGYKAAGAYFDGETVSELGGGICQVSSTLYYCVLLADLDVITRHPHSYPVSYVPMGMDATVSWGGPEFKFRNDTDYPIRIDAEVSGGYVKIKLIGTDEKDYYIKLDYKVTETKDPPVRYKQFPYDNEEGYKDGDVIQKGVTGYTVKTYKYKHSKDDNSLLSEVVESTSTYKTKDEIIAQVEPAPTEPPTEPPTEAPTEAPTEEGVDPASLVEEIIDRIIH